MPNPSSIGTSVNQFPPHIRELLIGDLDSDKWTEVQLIALCNRVISLSAVLACIEYDSKKTQNDIGQNNNVDTLIHNVFTEQYGLSSGASYCIIKEFRKEDFSSFHLGLFEEDVLSSWISLRNSVLKAKRLKQLFLLVSQTKDLAMKMLVCLYKIVFNKKSYFAERFLKHPETLPDNDFIIYSKCSECEGKHIFVFDHFLESEEVFVYCNWGLSHTLHVPAKSIIGVRLKRKYWGKTESDTSQVNIFPLFADSYSAMQKLADLLFKETTEETKKELWLRKCQETNIDMRSKILLDCINRSPIEVLKDVAYLEQSYDKERINNKSELEHYIQILSKSTISEKEAEEYISKVYHTIERTIKEKEIASDYYQREPIKQEILAYEVARLLGFPVKRYNEVRDLGYYQKIIDELSSKVENVSTDIDERGIMNKSFEIFESVLKDLYIFYSYLKDCLLQSLSQDKWRKKLEGIRSEQLYLGELYDLLLNINAESKNYFERLESLIGQRQFFNADKLNKITKKGSEKGEFIVTLRNHASHGRYKVIEGKGQLIVRITRDFLDFLGEENRRVYPYRIYFTILTRTHHGIRTCQYITNLTEKIEKKIYTEKEIDFQKAYYCIPNSRNAWKNIWVDPLLIPVDDVWCYD